MKPALDIVACEAVTAVGLDARQTCAAIRAKVKRIVAIETPALAHVEPRVGARVSAAAGLRRTQDEWLLNLAARALVGCLGGRSGFDPRRSALLLLVPEDHRGHPLSAASDLAILDGLCRRVDLAFAAPSSAVYRGGAGAFAEAIGRAQILLDAGAVEHVAVGGADSLLRPSDLRRLEADARLYRPETPDGAVPGEAGGFVLLARAGPPNPRRRAPRIRSVGVGYERATVLERARSTGDGFVQAVATALEQADIPEADVDFVASNFNGERYDAWERAHAHARCYRTNRDRLSTLWPGVSTGDVGVVGGVIALIAASQAIADGHAPGGDPLAGGGRVAMVEARSEGPLRGAVLLAP